MIALSNNAGLSADRVTAAILRDLHQQPTLAPKEALVRATALKPTPSSAMRAQPTPDDHGQQTELGTFTCDQAPGSLRLTRSAAALRLWRRGTCDQLVPTGSGRYAGNGYTLTVPATTDQIDRFTLDLDRAPGLTYIRQ